MWCRAGRGDVACGVRVMCRVVASDVSCRGECVVSWRAGCDVACGVRCVVRCAMWRDVSGCDVVRVVASDVRCGVSGCDVA